MSGETHTHGPGTQPHSHSHGPQPSQPPQQQILPPPDPLMQAVIDQQFTPVDLKLSGPANSMAVCTPHGLEKCSDCGIDFVPVNRLARIFVANPNIACPPPPNVSISQQLSLAVTKTKEEGNTLFKQGNHAQALQRYTMAANIAIQRPPWEGQNLLREELVTVISNRSAAFAAAGDHLSALVDADAVIQLKKPWSKGHFRKAKALVDMSRFEEAREAIQLGLQYEPNNQEMNAFLAEINNSLQSLEDRKSTVTST